MKTIGKYQLIAELFRSPVTIIYKAFHPALKRIVLIKQLHSDMAGDAELARSFHDEGLTMARISHPNLLAIYDAEIEDRVPFLVMEYVDGFTLAEHLSQHGAMPIDVIVWLLSKLAHALNALHQNGIVHRDIKPANILISFDGQIKLADLGFSITGESNGDVRGTPAYLAPETVMRSCTDARSDLFALGIVLYEMLTGINPFAANEIDTTLKRIVNMHPMPVQTIRKDVPVILPELIGQLLQHEPGHRLQTAGEVLAAIQLLLQQVDESLIQCYWANPHDYVSRPMVEKTPDPPVGVVRAGHLRRQLAIAAIFMIMVFVAVWLLTVWEGMGQRSKRQQVQQNVSEIAPAQPDNVMKSTVGKRLAATQPSAENRQIDVRQLKEHLDEAPKGVAPEPTRVTMPVEIRTDPRCWVVLNGDSVGISPVTVQIDTAVISSCAIKLHCPGFPVIEKNLHKTQVSNGAWFISLWDEIGYMMLKVQPWGEIWVDGDSLDITPLSQPLRLLPGRHYLLVRHRRLQSYSETISITAGDTLQRQISLLP